MTQSELRAVFVRGNFISRMLVMTVTTTLGAVGLPLNKRFGE